METEKNMRVAVVPMRSGSSLQDKNIRLFSGKPLFYWTIKKLAQMAKDDHLDKIIVSSDSEAYLQNVASCFEYDWPKGMVLSIRPKKLATGSSRTEDTIIYELTRHKIDEGVVLIVEVTSPLIPMDSLVTICKKVGENEIASSFLVSSDIAQRWEFKNDRWVKCYGLRYMRQEDNQIYKEVGAWAVDIKKFLLYKERLFKPWKPIEISSYQGISINTEMDFLIAEKITEINKL